MEGECPVGLIVTLISAGHPGPRATAQKDEGNGQKRDLAGSPEKVEIEAVANS